MKPTIPLPMRGTGWLNSFLSKWQFSTYKAAVVVSFIAVEGKRTTCADSCRGGNTPIPLQKSLNSLQWNIERFLNGYLVSPLLCSKHLKETKILTCLSKSYKTLQSCIPSPCLVWTWRLILLFPAVVSFQNRHWVGHQQTGKYKFFFMFWYQKVPFFQWLRSLQKSSVSWSCFQQKSVGSCILVPLEFRQSQMSGARWTCLSGSQSLSRSQRLYSGQSRWSLHRTPGQMLWPQRALWMALVESTCQNNNKHSALQRKPTMYSSHCWKANLGILAKANAFAKAEPMNVRELWSCSCKSCQTT